MAMEPVEVPSNQDLPGNLVDTTSQVLEKPVTHGTDEPTAKRLAFEQSGSQAATLSNAEVIPTPTRSRKNTSGESDDCQVVDGDVAERDALRLKVAELESQVKALLHGRTSAVDLQDQSVAVSTTASLDVADVVVSSRMAPHKGGAQFDILQWSKQRSPEYSVSAASVKDPPEDHHMQVVDFEGLPEDNGTLVSPGADMSIAEGQVVAFDEASTDAARPKSESVEPEVQWLFEALEPWMGKGREALAANIQETFSAFLLDRSRQHLAFSSSLAKLLVGSRHFGGKMEEGGTVKDERLDVWEFLVKHLIAGARYKDKPPQSRPEDDFPATSRWGYIRELAAQLGLSLDLLRLMRLRREARGEPELLSKLPDDVCQAKENMLKRAERYLHALQFEIDHQRDEVDARALKENTGVVDNMLNPTCSEFVFEQLLPEYAPAVGFTLLRQIVRAGAGMLIEPHDEDEVRKAAGMPTRPKKRARARSIVPAGAKEEPVLADVVDRLGSQDKRRRLGSLRQQMGTSVQNQKHMLGVHLQKPRPAKFPATPASASSKMREGANKRQPSCPPPRSTPYRSSKVDGNSITEASPVLRLSSALLATPSTQQRRRTGPTPRTIKGDGDTLWHLLDTPHPEQKDRRLPDTPGSTCGTPAPPTVRRRLCPDSPRSARLDFLDSPEQKREAKQSQDISEIAESGALVTTLGQPAEQNLTGPVAPSISTAMMSSIECSTGASASSTTLTTTERVPAINANIKRTSWSGIKDDGTTSLKDRLRESSTPIVPRTKFGAPINVKGQAEAKAKAERRTLVKSSSKDSPRPNVKVITASAERLSMKPFFEASERLSMKQSPQSKVSSQKSIRGGF